MKRYHVLVHDLRDAPPTTHHPEVHEVVLAEAYDALAAERGLLKEQRDAYREEWRQMSEWHREALAEATECEDRALAAEAKCDWQRRSSPDDIRDSGWVVGVHNDYRQHGMLHTFWLFTKGDRAIKGEGRTDAQALDIVRAAIAPDHPGEPESVETMIERCLMDVEYTAACEDHNNTGEPYWEAMARTANGTALFFSGASGPDLATAVRKCAAQYDAAMADRSPIEPSVAVPMQGGPVDTIEPSVAVPMQGGPPVEPDEAPKKRRAMCCCCGHLQSCRIRQANGKQPDHPCSEFPPPGDDEMFCSHPPSIDEVPK